MDEEQSDTQEELKMTWLEKSKYYAIILQCSSVFLTLINLIIYYCGVYTSWQAVMTFYVPIFMMVQSIFLWLNYLVKYSLFRYCVVLVQTTYSIMAMMVYILGFVWPYSTIHSFETTEEKYQRWNKDHRSPFQPLKYSIPGTLFVILLGGSVFFMIGKVFQERENIKMRPIMERIALEEENVANNNGELTRTRNLMAEFE